jgi:hypothetical protein
MSEYETLNDQDNDNSVLQAELEEVQKNIRALVRQLSKEQSRHHEIVRAYNLTVTNLTEMSRENAALTRERDQWRARAEGRPIPTSTPSATREVRSPFPPLSGDEVRAIRKAVARLHQPETTAPDTERMKLWNSILDPLEEASRTR